MAITATDWLITSDIALEAAFRVDLPEPGRGKWILSYLPTNLRLTRAQALSGIVLAEMILLEQRYPAHPLDREVAQLRAADIGITLLDAMVLLALRAPMTAAEQDDEPCVTKVRTRAAEVTGARG
ncbi:hypothetical protein [Nocardia goodfellowii]|uniref:Uncharacterized protein n=1 Tax=Nocardia goodfellowii TaxID=882446 RepID=A0ABS4Q8B3_9NOCA|nr:hypothetical protein [Nocardia goodfellowii]MBP2187936.1 hypothetical protein [Nocardia goodfellowii]